MITRAELTDEMIRAEMRRTTLVAVGVDCAVALKMDARTANGVPPSEAERLAARQRICDAINARSKETGNAE